MENTELLKKALAEIETLKKEVADLKSVSNLPIQVEETFKGRGFLNAKILESLDPLSYDSFNRIITVPAEGEDIEVLEWPFRWMKLENQLAGIDLYVPVYGKIP